MNLAVQYLRRTRQKLSDYEGYCGELVDGMIHWLGEDRTSILYASNGDFAIELDNGFKWNYHMVVIVGGRVHDAWFPKYVLPPKQYLEAAFPEQNLRGDITGANDDDPVCLAELDTLSLKDVLRNYRLLGRGIS